MSRGGRGSHEPSIRDNLPQYADVYALSLAGNGDHDRATDAMRHQLQRDVQALGAAGIKVEVVGEHTGRRYRLPPGNFSLVEMDLSAEERMVLSGALRRLRRDFPYSGPLHLAVANLLGAASATTNDPEATATNGEAFAAAIATREDEAVSRRVGVLETAVARRKRVRFDYYSISRDETAGREVEPYALSLLGATWYVTGWDTGRQAVRQFRLSRVWGRVVFATRKDSADFEVPENFERRLAGPRAPWQLAEPTARARVQVSKKAFGEARKRYLWAVSLDSPDETGEGRVLSTPYSGERQLAGWILSLGEEALALSPEPVVERVVAGLGRIADAHAPDASHEREEPE